MTQNNYRDAVITGLAARGVLRYTTLCKRAMLQKRAGTLKNVGVGAVGGGATGALIGALVQAARGKSVLKGLGVGGGIGAGYGAGAGLLASELANPGHFVDGTFSPRPVSPDILEAMDDYISYDSLYNPDKSTEENKMMADAALSKIKADRKKR